MYISTKIKNSILYFCSLYWQEKVWGEKISQKLMICISCVSLRHFLFFIFLKKEKEHNGSYEMPRNICAWKHSLHNDKVTVASACLCFSQLIHRLENNLDSVKYWPKSTFSERVHRMSTWDNTTALLLIAVSDMVEVMTSHMFKTHMSLILATESMYTQQHKKPTCE